MQYAKNFFAYINGFSRRTKIIAAVVIVVVLMAFFHFLNKSAPAADTAAQATHVVLASVASLSSQGGPLPVVGRVTSVSQASLSALSGGQITSVPHKLGDRVAAGSIIASFENSSQRAAVLQAQGSYDAALAGKAAVSPVDASMAAANAYRSAYATLDTAVHADIDTVFGGPTIYGPNLLINPGPYDTSTLSRQRQALDAKLSAYQRALAGAGSADPATLLVQASGTTADVLDLATKLATAAQGRESRATAEQLAALSAARTALNALSASLASAAQAYRSSSVTTTSSTDASITIALGGLRAAQAALEKTYVRAPIAGTIVSLPVHRGDFVAPGSAVAVISNPGALQIESYVTSSDAATLSVGGKATIEGTVAGTIVFIAPALDPTTGKILVKIAPSAAAGLSDGATVSVTLARAGTSKAAAQITIPIAAAKITPAGPVVFTVASSTLVAHAVTFGPVLGGQIAIAAGLTPDMDIVVDARGLSDGQTVVVDSQ